MTNSTSSFYYGLLILEKDRTFFFLISAHPKVKTILSKARHDSAIKMQQFSCAVSRVGAERSVMFTSLERAL